MPFFSLDRLRHLSSKSLLPLSVVFLVGAAFLASGCHPAVTDPKDPKFIVAERGNWKITRADLDAEQASYLKQHELTPDKIEPAKIPAFESAVLDNMLLKSIFMEKAAAMSLKDVDKEEADTLARMRSSVPSDEAFNEELKKRGMNLDEMKKRIHEDVLIHHVLQAEVPQAVEPTEQEINGFYIQHKDEFYLKEVVRASRVVILLGDKISPAEKAAKKKIIDKARDRVMHGEDFAKVASEVSEDQYSKSKGGDIGYFQKGQNENDPKFDEVAFGTKVNVVSPVFETALGYQFLKVTESRPAGIATVAEASPKIANYLRANKAKEQVTSYMKKLLTGDKTITYHLVHVDMPAQPKPGAPSAPTTSGNPDAAPASAPAAPSTNASK